MPEKSNATAQVSSESCEIRRRPAHLQAYLKLRTSILYGDLTPGEAVTIQGLVQNTGAGITPVREAIRRLTSEGALEFLGNRRVVVPTLSIETVNELTFLRETIEPKLASLAANDPNPEKIEWLNALDFNLDTAIQRGDIPAYLRYNHAFHETLYAMAKSPMLNHVANTLWLRFGPSMRIVCGRLGTQNLADNHKSALAGLRSRDATATANAIRQDVLQGMDQLRAALL
ncbi:GntR family transcriptional regulator [Shimia abyssi]|uniref:GntR family transcriptional regulator n=1 Tax=Shimia abyssi TaxID=1662395 RepID=A0A2P8F4A9_9RHOB|nr:GntR family transcriptional regulator [Shimia abyssi]PSL16551.1 GntR family transcriptional regulator [Shimia abyssi]